MPDTELLTTEERQEKIRKFINELSARFSETFWNNTKKIAAIRKYKPDVLEEFNKRWDELDKRCKEYLDGKIDWEGDHFQMEFTPRAKVPYPVLEVDRDVVNYGRELFVWFGNQTKDL